MTDPAVSPPANKRKSLLLILLLIFLLAGGGFAWRWLVVGQYRETTDNAYVGGNVVQITPRSAGTVVAIYADEMDPVHQGQALVALEDADARAALEQAKAELAEAVRQAARLVAQSKQQRAVITQREKELALAKDTERRREALASQKLAPEEEAQHAKISTEIAVANLEVARRELSTTAALIQDTPVAQQPTVLRAAAQLRRAYLEWARMRIPAPVSGFIAKRAVQLGQRVEPGDDLMALVPIDQLWVDANFKEDQLANLRLGQTVTLTADLYGSDIVFHGKVEGIAMGTGSAFALLPAQNASGNWIKIVQRVPVRIALEGDELRQHPLRLGLSMRVEVDTHDRSGAVLASAQPAARKTPVYDEVNNTIDTMIDAIVSANANLSKVAAQ
jgi:membrane fusion protein (multidrug efflux system)